MTAKRKSVQYTNESISSLKGADRVRKRPGVIFGSDGLEGCEHSVFEILSNSVDEARLGFGSKIIVTKFLDYSIQVQDFGRGIPVDWNQNEEKYNWELIFCELYAGGKFEAEDYGYSLGLNGLGLCATQYASQYMQVEILREGQKYNLSFKHGEISGEMSKEPVSGSKTGTTIKWKPDIQVFTDIAISDDYYADVLRRQAVVNKGVSFLLRVEREGGGFDEQTFFYADGIIDYLKERVGEETLTPIQFWQTEKVGRDREDKPDYKVKLSVAFCFSNTHKLLEYSHNSSFLEHGGSPDRAVKVAFTGQIDALLKQMGKYLKNESKITFQDVEDCLALFSSSFSTVTSYANQTKKAISNKFIYEAMADFLRQSLEVYFLENPDAAAKIAEQVLINKRSRENAEKSRLNLKKKLTGGLDVVSRVQKFVDCRSKDLEKREIYIVEGDSALGACKLSRDSEFQAIIPVRGKILNCLKAEYGKIFKNEIITDIIKVLGCGVEARSKASGDLASFDFNALRWNKVVICTDADVDGFQIRTLILTMLYRLVPTLIERGCVYIAESPLYEITAKDKTYFAYSEAEKARYLQKLGDKKYTIQRSKGLGENEPDMMWLTTMNPETRRLIKVTPTDAAATAEMFEILLGDNLAGRKEFIATVGPDYLEVADVS
ncbi:MAG: toprim domain-containing protein [Oscillospiraceae bacterium]|nr:toprim domain-containing protein [Oscillospiraceae bacterium]